MKVDDAIETITKFFNDLIGSLVPGAVLTVGLAIMHFGTGKLGDASKALDGAAVALTVGSLMFAAGHALMAVFDLAVQPLIRMSRLVPSFDENAAKRRQSYTLFAEIVNKLRDSLPTGPEADWNFNDLRNVALSVSPEAASLGRRFMFISLLCNGVGTALMIMLVDFWCCLGLNSRLLHPYDGAANWLFQSALLLLVAVALFRRGGIFYGRAMATPFSVALAELKLKKVTDAAK